MKKSIWIAAGLFLCVISAAQAINTEKNFSKPETIVELDGQITESSYVGSKILVRWISPQTNQARETAFDVDSGTKMDAGLKSIGLSDIRRGDRVHIHYKVDEDTGRPKLLLLRVIG